MSRKIKFRARAAVNDKVNGIKKCDWVYGSFVESGCDAPCIIFGDGEQIEIDRNTLGQFVNILDMDGEEIYEGHELLFCDDDGDSYPIGVVKWCDKDVAFVACDGNGYNWFGSSGAVAADYYSHNIKTL